MAVKIKQLRTLAKHLYYRIQVPFWRAIDKPFIGDIGFSVETSSICNLKCVFCAYQKTPFDTRQLMDDSDFHEVITQLNQLSVRSIGLTPMTGDFFVSKESAKSKLSLLEKSYNGTYSLTTNAVAFDHEMQQYVLANAAKLSHIKISIYGHDRATFNSITQTKSYDKLVSNLKSLSHIIQSEASFPSVSFGFRTLSSLDLNQILTSSSSLVQVISHLNQNNLVSVDYHRQYTNWGGVVTEQDLNGLDLDLKSSFLEYKSGPCSRLFSFMILADSRVVPCACRDGLREMIIGDLHHTALQDIVSLKNPLFMKWIDEHQNGIFNGPCNKCDLYSPVYAIPHWARFKHLRRLGGWKKLRTLTHSS